MPQTAERKSIARYIRVDKGATHPALQREELPELDADAIIDKILRRAELQFNYCAAGDDDPTTMQIKRACKEFKPTDTFPESFYSSIVSKIILHLDTHIDIKLRNGQTL